MTLHDSPSSHIYFSQRLRLHYVDWGNPTAPPLLLIHGARDHCRNWDWVAQALSKDYHVIAPDLRGHGDSQWISGGTYTLGDYVYDIAQLIHQQHLEPLRIVAHSMGGAIALHYAGLYPDKVKKLVAIEGLGPPPEVVASHANVALDEGTRNWIEQLRKLSGQQPRRFASIEEAANRMRDANAHLSAEQAHHLTIHGVNQNEDGTFSWKFDHYTRAFTATRTSIEEAKGLHSNITCPTLLIRGTESWASDPLTDGSIERFQNAKVENIDNAGHWVHHDRLHVFQSLLNDFL